MLRPAFFTSFMLISILLPVFNEARYLAECLDSILAQTHQDWELLVVDDFSTDATPQILSDYATRDARVKPFLNTEKGVIPALRLAYAHSKGAMITRMDGDDKMAPQKLDRHHALLLKHGPGHLCSGLVAYFSDETLGEGYSRYGEWINQVNLQNEHWAELYRDCPIPAPCWLVYREDLDRAEAFQPSVKPEDYDLIFRFRRIGLHPITAPEVLLYWRDHQDRTTRVVADYDIQRYFAMKLPWFLELDYQPKRPLVLWGAGKKGKMTAQLLLERKVPFHWVCDNPAKIGHNIYGVIMQDYRILADLSSPQVLLTVAQPSERVIIEGHLTALAMQKGRDYFWFC
jgi:glycosyltransferase involved in cell wall biosynthesis